MKVLCIKQSYPQDECGCGPNEYSFVFTENHSYYAAILEDWEEGRDVESDDYEENDNTYRFCLDEVIKYISDENTEGGCNKYDEYAFQAGWLDISEEEFGKIKLVKESALMSFVEDKVTDCFDISDNDKIRDCLSYLVYDFESSAEFGEYEDVEKEDLKTRIQKYPADETDSSKA